MLVVITYNTPLQRDYFSLPLHFNSASLAISCLVITSYPRSLSRDMLGLGLSTNCLSSVGGVDSALVSYDWYVSDRGVLGVSLALVGAIFLRTSFMVGRGTSGSLTKFPGTGNSLRLLILDNSLIL